MSRTQRVGLGRVPLVAACVLTIVGSCAAPARAAEDATTRRAMELFDRGNRLRAAGDCERALALFLESRALVSSLPNTLNAAYCAFRVGRYARALDLYEALLVEHADALSEERRVKVEQRVRSLLERVGRVKIHANVAAAIVVDGEPRGSSAGGATLTLLPGEHRVRLVRAGYQHEQLRVRVRAGEVTRVDAQLEPLRARGVLRIGGAATRGARVLVDGAHVGSVPTSDGAWEAALAPGRHVVALERGDRGTGPRAVTIIEGQVTLFEPALAPLGPALHLSVEPPTAVVTIDGVRLPGPTWTGRLTRGRHRFTATAEGYYSAEQTITVSEHDPRELLLRLEVDRSHPRWAVPAESVMRLGAWAGLGFGDGLGSAAEVEVAAARGWLAAARFEYELPAGLFFSANAGYLSLHTESERAAAVRFGDPPQAATYDIADDITLSGPFVAGGLGYRLRLGEHADVLGRALLGVTFATVTQDSTASVSADGDRIPADVSGTGKDVSSTVVFVYPGVELGVKLALLRVAAGLGVLWAPSDGPDNDAGDTSPRPRSGINCATEAPPLPVDCAISTGVTRSERSHGSFVLLVPSLSVSAAF